MYFSRRQRGMLLLSLQKIGSYFLVLVLTLPSISVVNNCSLFTFFMPHTISQIAITQKPVYKLYFKKRQLTCPHRKKKKQTLHVLLVSLSSFLSIFCLICIHTQDTVVIRLYIASQFPPCGSLFLS